MGAKINIPKPSHGLYLAKRNGLYNTFPKRDEQFYQKQGWKTVDYSQEVALHNPEHNPPPAPPPAAKVVPEQKPDNDAIVSIDDLKKAELIEMAERAGIEHAGLKVSELREAVRAAYGGNIKE